MIRENTLRVNLRIEEVAATRETTKVKVDFIIVRMITLLSSGHKSQVCIQRQASFLSCMLDCHIDSLRGLPYMTSALRGRVAGSQEEDEAVGMKFLLIAFFNADKEGRGKKICKFLDALFER